MSLKNTIAADATAVFCNETDFAESVTYYPRNYPGQVVRLSRTISAIVDRQEIIGLEGDDTTVSPVWEISVANDSTYGIASDEIDLGGDQIEFPPRDGKNAERKTILRMPSQDNGMLVLLCR